MVLNIIFAVLYAASDYFYVVEDSINHDEEATKKTEKFYTFFFLGYSLLSIVFGIYLAVSIYQIKKLIV